MIDPSIAQVIGEALQFITKQVIDATASWMHYEDKAVKALRTVGYSGEQLRATTKKLLQDTQELAKVYGVEFDKILEFQKKFNSITRSAAVLSSQSKEDFTAMTKLLGDSAPFEWAKAMDKFGMSAQSANAWLGKGRTEAKALGLNAEQFAQNMANAAKLQNRLNFKSGIQGLEKMTGLAMRLGTSIESLTKHIDIDGGAFSDIEKSIDSAAKLQRLGGSFGAAFSNPMEVMAEGMFDAESAMERVAKALEGKGTFDRTTGQVKMGWYDKKSIGVAAEALGISPDEARTMANRQVMGGAIEQDLKKSGQYGQFSQENIDAIKNLAQFNVDSGKFEITYLDEKGNEQTRGLNELTPENLDKIIGLRDNEKNIDRNVATIAGQVRLIADTMRGEAKDTTSVIEAFNGSKNSADAWKADNLGANNWMTSIKEKLQEVPIIGHVIGNTIANAFGHAEGGIIQSSPSGIEGIQKFANGGVVNAIASNAIKHDGYSAGELIKPISEPHDYGGLVGGASYSGDKVLTRLNSGEMVLNKAQQANLYNLATSKFTVGDALRKGRQVRKIYTSGVLNSKFAPTRLFSNNNYANRVARMQLRKHNLGGLADGIEKFSTSLDKGRSIITSTAKGVTSKGLSLIGKTKLGRNAVSGFVGTKMYIQQSKLYENLGKSIDKFSNATKNFGGSVKKINIAKFGKGGINFAKKGLSSVGKLATKADSSILKGTTKLLGKRAGNFIKGAGPLGVAISAGIGLMEAGSAISDFQDIKNNINSRDDLTSREKKQLVRQAEDNRNEKVGGAAGSVAGGAIGAALGSVIPVFGTTLGAMAGSFIGEKIGGFIGKNVNNIKETLFGKKAEMSEEDQAQLDYEESKFGATDLEDPQLMEKAALATIASHDLMISIWNHMNGKEFNGDEKSKGLFGSIADGAKGLVQGAAGIAGTLLTGPIGLATSAFKKKTSETKNEKDNLTKITEAVDKINANIEAFIGNYKVEDIKSEENNEDEINKTTNSKKGALIGGLLGAAFGPLGALAGASIGTFISSKVNSESIKPKPLGEDAVEVKNTDIENTSTTSSDLSSQTINLNINGTLKLDAGSAQKDIDIKKLLDEPSIKDKLIDLIWQGLEKRGGSGKMDKNTQRNVLQGRTRG